MEQQMHALEASLKAKHQASQSQQKATTTTGSTDTDNPSKENCENRPCSASTDFFSAVPMTVAPVKYYPPSPGPAQTSEGRGLSVLDQNVSRPPYYTPAASTNSLGVGGVTGVGNNAATAGPASDSKGAGAWERNKSAALLALQREWGFSGAVLTP